MTTIRVFYEMDGTVCCKKIEVEDGAPVNAKMMPPERYEATYRAYVKLPSIDRTVLIARAYLIDIDGPTESGHR